MPHRDSTPQTHTTRVFPNEDPIPGMVYMGPHAASGQPNDAMQTCRQIMEVISNAAAHAVRNAAPQPREVVVPDGNLPPVTEEFPSTAAATVTKFAKEMLGALGAEGSFDDETDKQENTDAGTPSLKRPASDDLEDQSPPSKARRRASPKEKAKPMKRPASAKQQAKPPKKQKTVQRRPSVALPTLDAAASAKVKATPPKKKKSTGAALFALEGVR